MGTSSSRSQLFDFIIEHDGVVCRGKKSPEIVLVRGRREVVRSRSKRGALAKLLRHYRNPEEGIRDDQLEVFSAKRETIRMRNARVVETAAAGALPFPTSAHELDLPAAAPLIAEALTVQSFGFLGELEGPME